MPNPTRWSWLHVSDDVTLFCHRKSGVIRGYCLLSSNDATFQELKGQVEYFKYYNQIVNTLTQQTTLT